jgi:hypothetical protein
MANLVGEHVSLREISGCAKAVFQFVVEAKIDVDFLIQRAIERSHGGLGEATAGAYRVSKQDKLSVAVLLSEFGQFAAPSVLHIVEDERDEIDEFVLLGRCPPGAALITRADLDRYVPAAPKQGEKILAGHQTEDEQQEKAPDAKSREASA